MLRPWITPDVYERLSVDLIGTEPDAPGITFLFISTVLGPGVWFLSQVRFPVTPPVTVDDRNGYEEDHA